MTYTIASILLDLTNFKPSTMELFLCQRSIGIKLDMYKYVINANSGEMAGLLRLVEMKKVTVKKKVQKSIDLNLLLSSGPFELEGDDRTHKIQMPNYVGSVKTMVIAGNKAAMVQ